MISTSSHVSRSGHRVTSSDPSSQSKKSRIPTIIRSPIHSSSKSCPQSPHDQKSNKASQIQKSNGGSSNIFGSYDSTVKKKCGFEAYMMTGDLILNLSRNQQSADILTTQFKKVHTHIHDTSLAFCALHGAMSFHFLILIDWNLIFYLFSFGMLD